MRRSQVRRRAALGFAEYSLVIAWLTLLPASSEGGTFDLLNRVMLRLSDGRID
jgi:hypothetical protein